MRTLAALLLAAVACALACAIVGAVACSPACAAAVSAASGRPVVAYDFEQDAAGWTPRRPSVSVERVESPGATDAGRAVLRVRGRMEGDWNYAISPRFPLVAGQLYRLTAHVRVRSLGPGTPQPFLKCEFVPADRAKDLGRAATDAYDGARPGAWQRLAAEFRAPDGVVTGWLALEKGTEDATQIDADLDDVRIEPIAALSLLEKYRLDPLPPALARVRGVHPRLYLTAEGVAALRRAVQTTHADMWKELQAQADRAARSGPPAYRERDSYSGDEQLWQRSVGNTMPVLAMAHLASGDAKYLDAARAWALASCSYPTWGLGRTDGMDLAAGHQLLGLGLVYDWCHDGLGDDARRTIRDTISRRGGAMFDAAAGSRAWWRRSYLQNHLWVNVTGMAAAGLAVFDEVDGADRWAGLALEKFRRTHEALGPDGASHEGVGYWQYGVEYMLKFMALARDLLGEDFYGHPWWKNTAAYAQYTVLPRAAWRRDNCIVDIADCPRGNWYGPDYLLRGLARAYHDGRAQHLAAEVDAADISAPGAPWLNLVWFDPAVAPRPPADLPTLRHFADMGLVSARSDWSGREALVVFKCGPVIGHEAGQRFTYDPGGGHVHPDANHFVLFAGGEWLIRDDGYRAKSTATHNTLLVGGRGQMGEGRMWLDASVPLARKARPRVIVAESSPALDHFAGDAAQAYPPEARLTRYVRHILFLKPDVLIVLDDVALAQGEADLELRFHPEQEKAARDGPAFVMRGKQAVLRLEALETGGADVAAATHPAPDRHGDEGDSMFAVGLRTRGRTWRTAVALSWAAGKDAADGEADGAGSGKAAAPPRVTLSQDGPAWTFTAGGRTVLFDWTTGAATFRARALDVSRGSRSACAGAASPKRAEPST
jgi:hypothetical protein